MNISFYNGVSGLIAFQEDMNIRSHNIANVNTTGFKGSRSSFSDLLYTRMAVNVDDDIRLVGHGVKNGAADLIYQQGPVLQTYNELDHAIIGDGLFAVEGQDGVIRYTRDGAFGISVEEKQGYLTASDGCYILDHSLKRIPLTADPVSGLYDLSTLDETIGIFNVPNPYDLLQASGNRFEVTERSGEAVCISAAGSDPLAGTYTLRSGALESSGMNLADEMVGVITAQRAYQMNAKMVQTADQLEDIINNLR